MTWSTVGGLLSVDSAGLSVNPTAIGNMFLVEIFNYSTSVTATALSSSNVTWALVKGYASQNYRPGLVSVSLFIGKATSTGAQTISVTWSGTAPTAWSVDGQQFNSTVGTWFVDKIGTLDISAGTNTWPQLTPVGAGELYWGFAGSTAAPVAGSTTGYTYQTDIDGDAVAYNTSCPGSVTGPVWGNSNHVLGLMVLVAEGSQAPPVVPVISRILAKLRRQPKMSIQTGMLPGKGLSGIPQIAPARIKIPALRRQPRMYISTGMLPGKGLSGIPETIIYSQPPRKLQRDPRRGQYIRTGMLSGLGLSGIPPMHMLVNLPSRKIQVQPPNRILNWGNRSIPKPTVFPGMVELFDQAVYTVKMSQATSTVQTSDKLSNSVSTSQVSSTVQVIDGFSGHVVIINKLTSPQIPGVVP